MACAALTPRRSRPLPPRPACEVSAATGQATSDGSARLGRVSLLLSVRPGKGAQEGPAHAAAAHHFMKGSMFLRNTLRPLGLLPLVYLRHGRW